MTIQEQVQKDMIVALKLGMTIRKNNLKFLLGQFQNTSKNREKTVTDEEAIKIIKNIVKSVKEVTIPNLLIANNSDEKLLEAYDFVELCELILPKSATEQEIKTFLSTVDFSQFKNKMQAIVVVTKHFNGNVDGNLVKEIVLGL